MKTHIVEITVSAKKGDKQITRWLVTKGHPYPSIAPGPRWENAGNLFPHGKDAKPTLENDVLCYLLRSDFNVDKMTGDRRDFAGYVPLSYDNHGRRVMEGGNPGCIIYRGESLGEMRVTFGRNPAWADISVRGYGHTPTAGERAWIETQIVERLRQFISYNAASLHADAVERLKKDVRERLQKHREELDEMEEQMNAAIAAL